MKKSTNNNIRRERIIMIASSVFVLTALTMTGLFMKNQENKEQDNGYSVDFTALENNAESKIQNNPDTGIAQNAPVGDSDLLQESPNSDLDYMPLEADSTQVEIPGLTGSNKDSEKENGKKDSSTKDVGTKNNLSDTEAQTQAPQSEPAQETAGEQVEVAMPLAFNEADGLVRPLEGDILLHYSMGSSIYFATLDQYKYNPAVMISAVEGTGVSACAAGKVISIFEDSEIGKALTLDLGNGYYATYGQLKDIVVSVDSYVNAGDVIASVAAPTKYFAAEGSNLYFRLEKDGSPINPENLF